MTVKLIIFTFIISLILIYFLLKMVKNDKIIIKYALVWLLPLIFILSCILFPGFMNFFSSFMGFKTESNMLIVMLIGYLFIICISLTAIVSGLKIKNKNIIQELSIIKSILRSKEK